MKPVSIEDLNYIAGFFDGEGSVYISTHGKTRIEQYIQYCCFVTISNTDKEVLLWIQQITGLGIVIPRKGESPRAKAYYEWELRIPEMPEFLMAILPYLKIKKSRTELMLEFLPTCRGTGNNPTRAEAEIVLRNVIYAELAELNKKGPK